ncbi:MAG: hypothetical protein FWB86_03615 [Treponema sp.]|nr:hypothetical protein [Treponema sp.]
MKKFTLFLFIICLFILPSNAIIFAEESEDYIGGFDETPKPFRIGDRSFEVGINAGFSVSNDFLSFDKIFQEKLVINLDDLRKGFKINFGMDATPFYLKFSPAHKKWGFGLFIGVDAVGAIDLHGDMLSFNKTSKSESDLGAAVFALAGIDTFFHIQKFKVKVNPTVFYPVAYIKRDAFSYKYINSDEGTQLAIGYDFRLYTGFARSELSSLIPDEFNLTASPGVDISLGVEFPLAKELGISKLLPFLDFDVGLDFKSIPIVSSTVRDYARYTGTIGIDEPIDLTGGNFDLDNFFSTSDSVGKGEEKAYRPFKMVIWANWRPFGSEFLTLTPIVGFAISPQYNVQPESLELGIKARLSLANLLILTVGICQEDRVWKNNADLALNFRAFEFNIGVNLQSSDFLKSWGSGIGLNAGLKFGW